MDNSIIIFLLNYKDTSRIQRCEYVKYFSNTDSDNRVTDTLKSKIFYAKCTTKSVFYLKKCLLLLKRANWSMYSTRADRFDNYDFFGSLAHVRAVLQKNYSLRLPVFWLSVHFCRFVFLPFIIFLVTSSISILCPATVSSKKIRIPF
jgi:hypothetical protein